MNDINYMIFDITHAIYILQTIVGHKYTKLQ